MGEKVGTCVGFAVGAVGAVVGLELDGLAVGRRVGPVGLLVGDQVGIEDGRHVCPTLCQLVG